MLRRLENTQGKTVALTGIRTHAQIWDMPYRGTAFNPLGHQGGVEKDGIEP